MNPEAKETSRESDGSDGSNHRVERFFNALGSAIASDLGSSQASAFSGLEQSARSRLVEFNPSAHITHADLIEYVLGARQLCKQADLDGKFAEPPVSLFRGDHFDISALTWLDGTTSIHQHSFCGAFHVLAGSSIHTQYRFLPAKPLVAKERARIGELQLRDIEVLKPGDTRVIRRGEDLIHSLFHMIRPSVTIVVRTITDDPDLDVQYDYRWPGLAHNPFQRHAVTIRKLQYLNMLRRLHEASFRDHCSRVLRDADLYLAYTLISEQVLISGDLTEAVSMVEQCTALDAASREILLGAARNDLLSRSIIELRRTLHDPDHRFLLALLLNVFDREKLLDLVHREYDTNAPVERIGLWLREMTGHTTKFPNLLGLDFNETVFEMLDLMWRGFGLRAVLAEFTERHGVAAMTDQTPSLSALFEALQGCALFAQVFRDLDVTLPA